MKLLLNTVIALSLLGGAARLTAQGSIQATFDTGKIITLHGVIKEVKLMNPATNLFVEVKDGNGPPVLWMLRLSPAGLLASRGFTRDLFRAGSTITAEVWAEKNRPTERISLESRKERVPPDAYYGAAWKLTFDDGTVLDEASRHDTFFTEPAIFPSQRSPQN